MTCLASHLTAIGVEEYTDESSGMSNSNSTDIDELPPAIPEIKQEIKSSWAVWVSIVLVLLMIAGLFWGYRRDNRDEIHYEQIRSDKKKLYVGLFLEPNRKAEKYN